MNSSVEKRIIKDFKLLSILEREEILAKLFSISKYTEEKTGNDITCPHCESIHFWKNGKLKDRQRYLCKRCRKSFNIFTNTPISYTKKDMDLWVKYAEELLNQTSLRKCAIKLGIALSTAFFWRHKLLDAIRENKPKITLKDEVLINQVYFRESFKGNHSKSNFEMPRKAYKHKFSWYQDNIGLPKNVCVLVAKDSRNSTIAAACCVGRPSAEDLIRVYRGAIKENTTIISTNSNGYKDYTLSLFINKLELSLGRVKDGYDTRVLADFVRSIRCFIKIYRGVSSKYLQNYIELFTFLENPFTDCPLILKGKFTFKNTNFKGRPPIFA